MTKKLPNPNADQAFGSTMNDFSDDDSDVPF
jgi:hypothetical protein